MTGRFNQDLPENLQMAFEKAANFKPRIIMKQSINSRKIHEINQIDVGQEYEIESTRPMSETLIIRVRIMIRISHKID